MNIKLTRMKILRLSAIALLSMGFFACGGGATGEDAETMADDVEQSLDGTDMSSNSTEWMTNSDNEYFTVKVPKRMEAMRDLNAEASVQYGYVKEEGNQVKEHYLIVLMETKEEIASYGLDMEFDAMSYRDISVEALEGGLDTYEVLTKEPEIEKVNGMQCVKNEMRGELGDINVFYKLGVFEGENAFYQVLTWCIEEQKGEFGKDMDKIIESFKEK